MSQQPKQEPRCVDCGRAIKVAFWPGEFVPKKCRACASGRKNDLHQKRRGPR